MFCSILGEAAVDELSYSRFIFKFSFFLRLSTWNWLVSWSVKTIMPLSTTLPLAIGLKCFWFLIALLLYQKSTILGLSFLDPKDLCLPNQLSRGS